MLIWTIPMILGGCGGGPDTVAGGENDVAEETRSALEIETDAFWDALEASENSEEQVALAREFLDEHPGSEHTGDVLSSLIGSLVDELGREDEAYEIFTEALARVSDPEARFEAQKQMAVLHAKTGRIEELGALALALEEEYELEFTDYLEFMETAIEAEAWELAIQQSDASLVLANADAFRAQWPDIEAEDAEAWGRRREAFSAAHKGWALENLGFHEEALQTFADNADKTTFSFLGVDDTPLHLRWGMSLVRQGRPEEAMELLAREALYGTAEAREAFAEAWALGRGSVAGLEEHLWSLRQSLAVQLPRFALTDYEGRTVDTADFAGKVILVAAWFPT